MAFRQRPPRATASPPPPHWHTRGRQQVSQLNVAPPVSYALHAHLIPVFSLERVAQTRSVQAGEPLRELAERLRTPLCEAGGELAALS